MLKLDHEELIPISDTTAKLMATSRIQGKIEGLEVAKSVISQYASDIDHYRIRLTAKNQVAEIEYEIQTLQKELEGIWDT